MIIGIDVLLLTIFALVIGMAVMSYFEKRGYDRLPGIWALGSCLAMVVLYCGMTCVLNAIS